MTTALSLVRSLVFAALLLGVGCSRSGTELRVPRMIPLARLSPPSGWKMADQQLIARRCWWRFAGPGGETMEIDAWHPGDGEKSSIVGMYYAAQLDRPHLTREWSKEKVTFQRYGRVRQDGKLRDIVTIVEHPDALLSVKFKKSELRSAGESDAVVENLIDAIQIPEE